MSISRSNFGCLSDGTEVDLYTLDNERGLSARMITYGARVVSLFAADHAGRMADVVLGCDSLDGYLPKDYMGAVIGRLANRLAGASFELNGVTYRLAANGGGTTHLHGGNCGFDSVVWRARPERSDGHEPRLVLLYTSRDGEEGYPGNLDVTVTYTLTADNALDIVYDAVSDADTVVSLTNHSFFNLNGAGAGDILDHEVMIDADAFTVIDPARLPTGEIRPVAGTPLDLRMPRRVRARIAARDEQMRYGLGYNHNLVLNHAPGVFAKAGAVYAPQSGRLMEFYTTEPGVQFYTGNALNGSIVGKGGIAYGKHAGLCLEAQHFPDSPHHANFPAVVLRAGAHYHQHTRYRFSYAAGWA